MVVLCETAEEVSRERTDNPASAEGEGSRKSNGARSVRDVSSVDKG